MQRHRYSIEDDRFKITIKYPYKEKIFLKPNGRLSVDKNNCLVFISKESKIWHEKYKTPQKIILEGKWNLDEQYKLSFCLRKTKTQFEGDKLYFKTHLVGASAQSLVLAIGSQQDTKLEGVYNVEILKLNGRWQADRFNQLSFLVTRSYSGYDTLTLQGMWAVKNNCIVFRRKKTKLLTKDNIHEEIVFKGFWQILRRNCLSYVLDVKSNSTFAFKVNFGTTNIMAKKDVIKYRVGIGSEKKVREKIFSLSGTWTFGRERGLFFNVDYGNNKFKTIKFGFTVYLAQKEKIVLELQNDVGEKLGIQVCFTKSFWKRDARCFLRFKNMTKNMRVEAGVDIVW
ncbi:MAG: hypothetical protein DRP78_03695 [Candidatus Omnitrophota bacterium]|nr:MAG: hypothetical protein DRP78_03695 [Candidatus Omnitrophota bacterium]